MSFQQLLFVSGETPAAVVATGGTIYTNGDYKIHAFTTSGYFRVTAINNVNAPYEYWIVGAGDGGLGSNGSESSGCGGAGGGDGGQGGGRAFGSGIINAFTVNTDYLAEVGTDGNGSSFKGNGAGASGGGSAGFGGAGGYPPTSGTAGTIPESITWISGVTTRLGAGGGGGGGGADQPESGGEYGGGNGGLPAGGSGGGVCSNGNNGYLADNLYWPGHGSGGGGGGGGCCDGGQSGGLAGPGGTGLVIIRYKFQNV